MNPSSEIERKKGQKYTLFFYKKLQVEKGFKNKRILKELTRLKQEFKSKKHNKNFIFGKQRQLKNKESIKEL